MLPFIPKDTKITVNEHIVNKLTSEFEALNTIISLFEQFNYNLIGYITFRYWESDWSGFVLFVLEETTGEKYILYDFGSCTICDEFLYYFNSEWKDNPEKAPQWLTTNHSYTIDELFNEIGAQNIIDVYKIKPLQIEETDEFKRYLQKAKKVLS